MQRKKCSGNCLSIQDRRHIILFWICWTKFTFLGLVNNNNIILYIAIQARNDASA